jgi:hypothetical protein
MNIQYNLDKTNIYRCASLLKNTAHAEKKILQPIPIKAIQTLSTRELNCTHSSSAVSMLYRPLSPANKNIERTSPRPFQLQFPDADTIKEYLNKHPLLNKKHLHKQNITDEIATYAAKRFANKKELTEVVQINAIRIVNLIREKKKEVQPSSDTDGFIWSKKNSNELMDATFQAFLDCAISSQNCKTEQYQL